MAYLVNWKAADTSRRRIWTCNYCKFRNLLEKRQCFWEHVVDFDERLVVDYKDIVEGQRKTTKERFSVEEIFEYLFKASVEPEYEGVADLKLFFKMFPSVCPISLAGFNDFEFIDLHETCKQFKKLPFPGSVIDQPKKIMDIFNAIMEGEAQHQTDYLQDIKDNAGKR